MADQGDREYIPATERRFPHVQKRLKVDSGLIWTVDDERIAHMERDFDKTPFLPAVRDSNAHRLVECWNACDGIANPGGIEDLVHAAKDVLMVASDPDVALHAIAKRLKIALAGLGEQ